MIKVAKVYRKYRNPTWLDREERGTVYINPPYKNKPAEMYIQINDNYEHPIWVNVMNMIYDSLKDDQTIVNFIENNI